MRAMEVALRLPGFTAGTQRIDALTKAVERLAAADKQLGGGRTGGAAGGVTPAVPGLPGEDRLKIASGPAQRLVQAQEEFHAALQRGTQAQMEDAQRNLERAKEMLEKARNPAESALPQGPFQRLEQARKDFGDAIQRGTEAQVNDARERLVQAHDRVGKIQGRGQQGTRGRFMDLLGEAVSSSRFSAGSVGGMEVMPLASKVAPMLGLSSAAMGPIGIAVAGISLAGEAAKRFADTVAQAAGETARFANAVALSGGTTQQVAQLTSMGVDPLSGDRLRQLLSNDPVAMANSVSGAQAPITHGGQNNAGLVLREIEGIRALTTTEDKLRRTRILQQEANIDLILASDKVFEATKRDAMVRAQIYDPKTQATVRDASVNATRFEKAMENLRGAAAKPLFGDINKGLDGLTNTLNLAALGLEKHGPAIKDFFGDIIDKGLNAIGAGPLKGLIKQAGSPDAQAALNANTNAVNKNTTVLQQGLSGAGARGQAAINAHIGGWTVNQAAAGRILRYGGVTIR
jgi:hypothetical protein